MMDTKLENKNPTLYNKSSERDVTLLEQDDEIIDPFDAREIFGKSFYLEIHKLSFDLHVL